MMEFHHVAQWIDRVKNNGNHLATEWMQALDLDVLSGPELWHEARRMMTVFNDPSLTMFEIQEVMRAAAHKGCVDAQYEIGFRLRDHYHLQLAAQQGHECATAIFEIRNQGMKRKREKIF